MKSVFEVAPPAYSQLDPVRHGVARVWSLSTGPLNQNCLLVADDSGAALLIDPGAEAAQIERMVEMSGAEVEAILLTHAHPDHLGALESLRAWLGVPAFLHPLEADNLAAAPALAHKLGLPDFQTPRPPEGTIQQGQIFTAGQVSLAARELPGHTAGHVIFVGIGASSGFVLAGDTLFAGGMLAPTNLPGSDRTALLGGIVRELLILPPQTVIYPGHGAPTIVAAERERALFRRRLWG